VISILQKISFLSLFAILLYSCGNDEPVDAASNDKKLIEAFLENNPDIEAALIADAGIFKQNLVSNDSGSIITSGTIVNVFFTIRGLENVVIDISSTINGGPSKMQVGASAIYPIGFDAALATMRVGEKSRFFIPSNLAYGDLAIEGLIEKNAILDVEIEVASALTVDQQHILELNQIQTYVSAYRYNDNNPSRNFPSFDGGGRVRITDPKPDSIALVGLGENIGIKYVARLLNNGAAIASTTGNDIFEFKFGSGEVIVGLDRGISGMRFNEKAIILFPSSLGYGASVKVMPDLIKTELVDKDVIPEYASRIGPFQPLLFEVHLQP
jgi:FKBP-type peptidyl-prolyl cis-trans isomerase